MGYLNMMVLHTTQGKKVLINPLHVVLVREAATVYNDPYIEVFCGAEMVEVKETLDEIQMMLHQFNKK
jgi:hypothetical protein